MPPPKPSDSTDEAWLFAVRKIGVYPPATDRSGKWMLFVPTADVDRSWEAIRVATESGALGFSSKVATAKPGPYSHKPERLICVYTYDWTDQEDVQRIRAALRSLGFTAKIPYKADQDTDAGVYSGNGGGRVSRYYE